MQLTTSKGRSPMPTMSRSLGSAGTSEKRHTLCATRRSDTLDVAFTASTSSGRVRSPCTNTTRGMSVARLRTRRP